MRRGQGVDKVICGWPCTVGAAVVGGRGGVIHGECFEDIL